MSDNNNILIAAIAGISAFFIASQIKPKQVKELKAEELYEQYIIEAEAEKKETET